MYRIRFTVLVFILFALGMSSTLYAQEEKPLKVLLLTHKDEGFRNAFWNALRMGGENAAAAVGVEFEYRGVPLSWQDNRPGGQDVVIRSAVSRGISGIVVTPSDTFRLANSVRFAVLSGVPVVSIDSAIESNLLSGVVLTNNYQGGLSAAEFMVNSCGGTGGVVMLAHPSRGNKATLDREQAFIEGLARLGPEMRLLSGDRFGDATIESDYVVLMELLKEFPKLKGLYSVSGSGLAASMRALKDSGLLGKVILIGWDADKDSVAAMKRGEVHGIMQQDPESMAKLGMQMLLSAIEGSPERRYVDITATLITKDTLETPAVRRLLAPMGLTE